MNHTPGRNNELNLFRSWHRLDTRTEGMKPNNRWPRHGMDCEPSVQVRVTLIELLVQSGKIFVSIAKPAIDSEHLQLSGVAFKEKVKITVNSAANCFSSFLSLLFNGRLKLVEFYL